MAIAENSGPSVRVVQEQGAPYPQILIESPNKSSGKDIAQFCRKVDIHLACDSVNTVEIEAVNPALDVLSVLEKSVVVHIQECPSCGKRDEKPNA